MTETTDLRGFLWFGVLVGLTGLIACVDHYWVLKGKPRQKGSPASWGIFGILAICLNVAALPYYFHQTRGTRLGFWIGAGFAILCAMASMAVLLARILPDLR